MTVVMGHAQVYDKLILTDGSMVEGRIEKYFKDVCLLDQAFVKDTDKTIKDVITEAIAAIGENISIRRFVRYEMGEGLQKREDNFVDEVMGQMKK